MRPWRTLGPGLLAVLLAGCLPSQVKTTSWLKGRNPLLGAPAPNSVQLELALLECPIGDPYINHDLWTLADEQIVRPENKAALEDNGFRVAQVGGIIPAELQTLLTSKRTNINPRRRTLQAGVSAPVCLGPPVPTLRFAMVQDGEPVEVELEQAQCKMVVTPRLTADDKVLLHFTPRVEHGEQMRIFQPDTGSSDFMLEVERPHKDYPALSWEVALGPNQYLVIGARLEQRRSLGFASLVQAEEHNPVQRLLVIRTSRPSAGVPEGWDDADAEQLSASRSPPLALQAQTPWSAARGRSE
jgi:hypothetical protein